MSAGRISLALLGGLLLFCTGCSHFGEDLFARNERGEWYDFAYKMNLAWNQGGAPLEVLSKSTDGDLRRRAILRMTEPGDAKTRSEYINILATAAKNERDEVCRLAAVQQLATYKDEQVAPVLIEAYQHPNNNTAANGMIRIAALDGMSKYKAPEAMEQLVAALETKNNDSERSIAARGLKNYPNYRAAEALLNSMKQERNVAVRTEAHQSLVKMTGRDLPNRPEVWEQAFHDAAAKREPLAKPENSLLKLVNFWE